MPACLVPYRHMIFCRMGRAKRNPSKYRLQPIIISPCPASQSRRMLPKSKIKSMITRGDGRRLCLRRAGNFIQCFADCCGIHRADQTGNSLPSLRKIRVGQSVMRKDRPSGRPLPSSTLICRISGCLERAESISGWADGSNRTTERRTLQVLFH